MSVWICREHGLYGGSGFCPSCGHIGSRAQIASADEAAENRREEKRMLLAEDRHKGDDNGTD